MKRAGILALTLAAISAWAAGQTTIDQANRRINGTLTVVGATTLSGGASQAGVNNFEVVDAGTLKVSGVATMQTVDAGDVNVAGQLTVGLKIPVARIDVLDAGVIFAQGFGPVYRIIPFTSAAIDFASTTTTCTDSAAQTATGARTTDTCTVGMPSTLTAGGTGLNGTYSCYVSASDAVKVRHCAAGTADDPGSVTFTGYVISAQP
jgi:hypothetical protein